MKDPLPAACGLTVALLACAPTHSATLHLTQPNSTFTQDFDGLGTKDGTQATLDANLPGLEFFESKPVPNSAITADSKYMASDGSKYGVVITSSDTYNFGTFNTTDRAFGSLSQGLDIKFGFNFTNDTGSTITGLAVGYRGEQWSNGFSDADKLNFEYSTDATSLTSGTYLEVGSLNFASPANSSQPTALDGNAAANAKTFASTPLSQSLSIPVGGQFFVRFVDVTTARQNDGLAIDDFSLTITNAPAAAHDPEPAAVPEPLAATAGLLLLAVGVLPRCRHRPLGQPAAGL